MMHSYRTLNALPRLLSYEDAAKREEQTKPIRGDELQTKPLGRRNQKYRAILRRPNGDIWVGYRWHMREDQIRWDPKTRKNKKTPPEPFLAFHPDNTISIQPTIGCSEQEIISEVLGHRITFQTRNYEVWFHVRSEGSWSLPQWHRLCGHKKLQLTEGGVATLHDAPAKRWLVDRKGKGELINGQYAAFVAYHLGMCKVRSEPPGEEEYIEVFGKNETPSSYNRLSFAKSNVKPNILNILNARWWRGNEKEAWKELSRAGRWMRSARTEDHYRAHLWLLANHHVLMRASYSYSSSSVLRSPEAHITRVLLHLHTDTVLREVEAGPAGRPPSVDYARFLKDHEDAKKRGWLKG
jgi:hypothetical protein